MTRSSRTPSTGLRPVPLPPAGAQGRITPAPPRPSSPAKRGRGTMRSMVVGALSFPARNANASEAP
jgi:hypothetical protein